MDLAQFLHVSGLVAVAPRARLTYPVDASGALMQMGRLGAITAQTSTLFGKARGFFIRYDYAGAIKPASGPYPEVECIFERSPYAAFVDEMASHIPAFETFGDCPNDPEWDRGMFPPLDGAAAYTAVRKFRPRRIIEIGSGDSTHYLAKAAEGAKITCIDPQPRRSIGDLPVDLIGRIMDNSDADLCEALEADDILFIDSSHIMLPGMDVDIQFNRCFPRLKKGVLVHLHDIFLPDGYPPHWADRHYSEQNVLIGWIISGFFEVIYPGHYVVARHPALVDQAFAAFPPALKKNAGSLWLRKS